MGWVGANIATDRSRIQNVATSKHCQQQHVATSNFASIKILPPIKANIWPPLFPKFAHYQAQTHFQRIRKTLWFIISHLIDLTLTSSAKTKIQIGPFHSYYKCVIPAGLRLSKAQSYYDQITVYRLSVAAYLGAWYHTEIPDMVGCVDNKLTTEVAPPLKLHPRRIAGRNPPSLVVVSKNSLNFLDQYFLPPCCVHYIGSGSKFPAGKNSTMSFWLMGWSTIGMTLPILLLWAWAIWCCYNCNESLESFANPGKLKMQIGTENWVFRNDFSISASAVMRIVVRYRRVRKTAAEPAFMRKIWRLGRIQKNMAARKN